MIDPFDSTDFLFDSGPDMFTIVFIVIIGIVIFAIVKGIMQWHENEQSPRLTVPVTIASKRSKVDSHSHMHHHDKHAHAHHTTTTYYVTVEFESGDRKEFHVSSKQYGLLKEGDNGDLTFQGTRFLEFQRNIKP